MKMAHNPPRLMMVCGAALLTLLFGILISSGKADTPARVILEVVNKHHTMGRDIPSVYLRVFSDGAVECHTQKFISNEIDSAKRKSLAPEELRRLKSLLEDPDLSQIDKRYGLMYTVIDSWMEWDIEIKVEKASKTQSFKVLNFAPGAARERGQPYPNSLVNLGCSIVKLRVEVYEGGRYNVQECEQALTMR